MLNPTAGAFDALLDGELSVSALVENLGTNQPLVSKHLRVVRDAGVVEVRMEGQRRLYRLRAQPLAGLDAWMAPYRQSGPPAS